MYNEDKKGDNVIQGVPMTGGPQKEDGAPPGHARYYCEKCQTPYDLPHGSTSW
eukprot:CAMPEP_0203662904 /NCGR_PEP_ID=MMETSP0090-20130426/703_1 /ASSEMBLY_ACC=CAM_ASM_001088 /TAXON_ID=426623 /ORGANISM="Chaetoceros affinis, Strain CCMP159" /LENGTH=52 /DNA_ID=CAMNT_0050525747 /DNA_START=52 /DNA_END=207 /DNA_ORIENTATION=+